jgi:hypothetical protein
LRDSNGRLATDRLAEDAVLGIQDVARFSMMAGFLLRGFLGVTLSAVAGRNDDCNRKAIVIESIGIVLFCLVALIAADPGIPVRTVFPLTDDARHGRVTAKTFLGLHR